MIVEKASAAVAYGGGGTAVVFGLTASEWSIAGVIGGLVIGLVGLVVNAYYKHQHYRLAREHLEASDAVD